MSECLNDCCFFVKEKVSISKVSLDNYVSTENLNANKGGKNRAASLPNAQFVDRYLNDDILISNIRPYFKKIWYATNAGGSSADVLIFRSKSNTYSKFLYYLLSGDGFFDTMTSSSKGTKMPRGDKSAIMNYKINLPSLDEQKAIADVLSALDDKIELNNKINKNLEQQAQALFKHWFVDFEFPNENGEPYKSSGGEMKDSELGLIPKDWGVQKLEDIIDIQNGYAFKSIDYIEKGITLIRTSDFNELFSISTLKNIKLPLSFFRDDKYSNFRLSKFDVLLVMVGASIGNISVVTTKNIPALQNQNMWRFRAKNDIYKFHVLFYTISCNEKVKNSAVGSAREFYHKEQFKSFSIPKPNKSINALFYEMAKSAFEKIDNNIFETQKLATIRDYLLPKLISGEIRVN